MSKSQQLILSILTILIVENFSVSAQKYPEMIFVKGGTFRMGSKTGDKDEVPVHKVSLKSYYIGKYEVTVAQYKLYCKETGKKMPALPNEQWYDEHPNAEKWEWRDKHPIANVTWDDAMSYCKWLSKKTGEKYSLPTEAQWEYAAKGGRKSKHYIYSGSKKIDEVAWYDDTTLEKGTKEVGMLKPNELGIYDMSGNVWEWCYDYFGRYSPGHQIEPKRVAYSPFRVVRGGSWYYIDELARLTARDGPRPDYTNFNYGFRVAKNM